MRRVSHRASAWLDRIAVWRTLAVWLAIIFGLSSIPNNFQTSDSPIPADKIAHGIEFAVLAAMVTWMLRRRRAGDLRFSAVAAAVVLSTLYGVSDEMHQRFVPGRDVSVMDLVADAVGALAGACLAAWLPRYADADSADGDS